MSATVPNAAGFEFWQRQIERLGERDPWEVLTQTSGALEQVVASRGPKPFETQPGPGKWSAAEVMGHLVDIEFVFGFRIRTILSDDRPSFGGIDQDRWVEQQAWRSVPPAQIARCFRQVREVNLACWQSVPPEAMTRTGRHREAGVDLSLELMLRILAGHDLVHLDQLYAVLDTVA